MLLKIKNLIQASIDSNSDVDFNVEDVIGNNSFFTQSKSILAKNKLKNNLLFDNGYYLEKLSEYGKVILLNVSECTNHYENMYNLMYEFMRDFKNNLKSDITIIHNDPFIHYKIGKNIEYFYSFLVCFFSFLNENDYMVNGSHFECGADNKLTLYTDNFDLVFASKLKKNKKEVNELFSNFLNNAFFNFCKELDVNRTNSDILLKFDASEIYALGSDIEEILKYFLVAPKVYDDVEHSRLFISEIYDSYANILSNSYLLYGILMTTRLKYAGTYVNPLAENFLYKTPIVNIENLRISSNADVRSNVNNKGKFSYFNSLFIETLKAKEEENRFPYLFKHIRTYRSVLGILYRDILTFASNDLLISDNTKVESVFIPSNANFPGVRSAKRITTNNYLVMNLFHSDDFFRNSELARSRGKNVIHLLSDFFLSNATEDDLFLKDSSYDEINSRINSSIREELFEWHRDDRYSTIAYFLLDNRNKPFDYHFTERASHPLLEALIKIKGVKNHNMEAFYDYNWDKKHGNNAIHDYVLVNHLIFSIMIEDNPFIKDILNDLSDIAEISDSSSIASISAWCNVDSSELSFFIEPFNILNETVRGLFHSRNSKEETKMVNEQNAMVAVLKTLGLR